MTLNDMEVGSEAVITAVIDHEANRDLRQSWGVFRDRRPELYGRISHH